MLGASRDVLPDLTCCASGGVVVAYLMMAADYRPLGLINLSATIRTDLFIKDRYLPVMSKPLGILLHGSMYGQSDRISPYMHALFPGGRASIQRREVCTLLYNTKTKNPCIATNVSREASILQGELPFETIYANGDIDLIAKTCVASAALPFVVGGVPIEEHVYQDAGIYAPSPFTPMFDLLQRGRYKIIYLTHDADPSTSSVSVVSAINGLTHSNYMKEVELLKVYVQSLAGTLEYKEWHGPNAIKEGVAEFATKQVAALLLSVPFAQSNFSLLNLDGNVVPEIRKYDTFVARLWSA